MRPWLLLVSLLVSDLSPPGDGDRAMDYYCWCLCRKLLQMTPQGLEVLQTQTKHHCIWRKCACVALQYRLRTSLFYWTHIHDDNGRSLSLQEYTGIIQRNHIPALVVSLLHGKRKGVPAFLLRSDTPPALHVISEASRIAMDIIKGRPDSWTLHHHTAASGHNFQAFLLEKTKSWANDAISQMQKMLTKRYCAATTVIISCCFKAGEMRSAMNIEKPPKQQIAQPQRRQKESARRPMDIKVHVKYNRRAAVRQRDVFQAAALRSGSSAPKTSNISQSESNSARAMKKNEHLNLLLKRPQKQHPLTAASSEYDNDDDGFNVERRLLLVPREKTGSINRPQSKIKATQDGNKVDFNVEIITRRAESRRQEGESETQRSQTNTDANGNHKRLAHVLQADFTHKTDDNDVDTKQVLTEAGEEVLIMLFLPDTERETQTDPSSCLNSDTGWETVKTPIKLLCDPRPLTKVLKESFFSEPGSLRESLFSLEMYVLRRTEGIDLKPAERRAKVTTAPAYTEKQVKVTEETTAHTETNNSSREYMGINHTEQEGNVTSEESVTTSPPSLQTTERETAETARTAETTTVNTAIKETTSSTEVFNQGGTHKADGLPSTEAPRTAKTETGGFYAGFIKWKTGNEEAPIEKSFSGLRMRQDVPAETIKPHEETNKPQSDRKVFQNDPKVNSFTAAKPLPTIYRHATDTLQKAGEDNTPLCRGLIHRTEAGRKHCAERSKTFSTGARKDTGEQEKEHTRDQDVDLLNDDEYEHFYYFDGVLRRVGNHFYPHYKRQRRRKRSPGNTEKSALRVRNKGDTQENVLSYIRRLTSENKASRFK